MRIKLDLDIPLLHVLFLVWEVCILWNRIYTTNILLRRRTNPVFLVYKHSDRSKAVVLAMIRRKCVFWEVSSSSSCSTWWTISKNPKKNLEKMAGNMLSPSTFTRVFKSDSLTRFYVDDNWYVVTLKRTILPLNICMSWSYSLFGFMVFITYFVLYGTVPDTGVK